jgi:multiple RNA-binding domain-containing protein 1
MSRIIVKNIPKEITDKELSDHFSKKGVITDVKIMKKENGQSRKFAFIGFKKEEDGINSIKYFNNTFLWTCKIIVESALVQSELTNKKPFSNRKNLNNNNNNNKKSNTNLNSNSLDENLKENKLKKILELAKEVSIKGKFDALNSQMQKELNDKEKEKENNNLGLNENDNNIETKESKNHDKEMKKFNLEENKLDPKRLYLKNIPFKITEEEIREKFKNCGVLTEVHIPKNFKTGESFGYAYIAFATIESSILAIEQCDKTYFQGRTLHISIAEKKQEKVSNFPKDNYYNENAQGKSDYKTQKKEKLRGNFDNENNWNYLFMNQNAVVEAVSQKLGIPKQELLSKENANLSVQVAAMETTIINETKEWLKDNAFNLDILKGKRNECKRSKNTIFIKNISPNANKEKLEETFGRYGQLTKFLVSPSNTLAIAEFSDSQHAVNCIKKLAYYEIESVPLYLEFAPEGLIENEKEKTIKSEAEAEAENDIDKLNKISDINLTGNEGKILFIMNLNFNTKENALKKFFIEQGFTPNKVKIATHLKEGKDKPVSSGFGFMEFENEEDPQKILRTLQGTLLHGHSLKLSLAKTSEPKKDTDNLLSRKRKNETELNDYEYEGEEVDSTKLLIRNLAFEANKDELRKLFAPFGEIKSLRIPLKMDGTHRGFAFIEFISHEESKKAFKSLSNSHFYGRKLVIEWANKEKSIEEMRADTERKLKVSQIETHRTQKKANLDVASFK